MPARVATGAALALTLAFANAARLWTAATAPAWKGVFAGQLWGAYDLPQYVEAIREGAAGHLLFEGRVWGVADGAYLLETPYLLAGIVLSPLRLDSFAVLEVLRWAAQLAALASLVLLVRAAVPAPLRAWAVLFSTVAGGLGWLFVSRPPTPLGPVLPMDVATPSATLLNGFLAGPHLALMAAVLMLFAWGFLAVARGDRRGFLALLGWPLALTIHPFEVVSVLVAVGAAAIVAARRPGVFAYLGLAGLVSAAGAAYVLALILRHDPVVTIQAPSVTTEVGDLPGLLVSRAFVLPLAVAALWPLRRDPVLVLLATWAGVSAVLNIQPFDAGGPLHRSLEGASAAFGCLAARGLPAVSARWRPAVLGAVLVSPLVQTAALVESAPGLPEAWVPRPIVAVAREASDRRLQGAVLGDAAGVRWLVALSDLREAVDDPVTARARMGQVENGRPLVEVRADYLLVTGGDAPGLTVVVSVPGAALYR